MVRQFAGLLITLGIVGFAGIAAARDDDDDKAHVTSGLEAGAKAPAYQVRDVTGPSAGETLCYRCKFGDQPVVNVFTRDLSEKTVGLITKLDAQAKEKGVNGFVVYLTDDVAGGTKKLKAIAAQQGIKTLPLTIYEGTAGPKDYKLAKEADLTILYWSQGTVKINQAFRVAKMCEGCLESCVDAVAEIAPKKPAKAAAGG